MTYFLKTIEWLMDRLASNKEILEANRQWEKDYSKLSCDYTKETFKLKREKGNLKMMVAAQQAIIEDLQKAYSNELDFQDDDQIELPYNQKAVPFHFNIKQLDFEIYCMTRGRK